MGMATDKPQKNYLLGGIVLCAFPAVVLLSLHLADAPLPMPWPIFFGVLFVHGIRAVMVSLFGLDLEGAASWIADAIATAGFAVMALWVAWNEKDGWSGGMPLIPDAWNQMIPRVLFAGGGLICVLAAARCVRKAFHVHRRVSDEGIRHT